MNYIYTFIGSFLVLTSLDILFLGYLMSDYYKRLMSPAVTIEFSLLPAFLFYFVYVIAILYFVVLPNVNETNIWKIILTGAAFGFVCYATYDLTNYATIKNWPLKLVFIDLAWGTFITALTSLVTYKILNFL